MTLVAVQSRGLVEQVFAQLASAIMSGAYPVDAHLPSERALAESLHVNRQVVREASRRLAQIGLVQVLHGDGTRVLDFRVHGGLDLLSLLMESAGARKTSLRYWLPILELRSALAPDVVRHCAKRAKPAVRQQLQQLALEMSRSESDPELYALEGRFWDLVHEGADHIVYRLTYNSFRRCGSLIREQSQAWVAAEVRHSGYRVKLADAIARGDAERAEAEVRNTMRSMLEAWVTQIEAHKGRASKSQSTPPTKARASKAKAASSKPAASRAKNGKSHASDEDKPAAARDRKLAPRDSKTAARNSKAVSTRNSKTAAVRDSKTVSTRERKTVSTRESKPVAARARSAARA